MISLQVLEALLSTDAARRQAAEAHFQSTPVNERVVLWPTVWQQTVNNTTTVQQQQTLAHMIAVLWRRDILKCTVDTNVLVSLLGPLQQIFGSSSPSAIVDDKVRAAVGHCLAEVVALLQTNIALEQTLQGTEALVGSPLLYNY